MCIMYIQFFIQATTISNRYLIVTYQEATERYYKLIGLNIFLSLFIPWNMCFQDNVLKTIALVNCISTKISTICLLKTPNKLKIEAGCYFPFLIRNKEHHLPEATAASADLFDSSHEHDL